jgi:hypothetical protein
MATTLAPTDFAIDDPLDVVERVAIAQGLNYERYGGGDLAAEFSGRWCAYQLWFAYRADLGSLNIACGFDMRVPPARRDAIYPLLALINEQLWLGHFDLWTQDGQPTWRHALMCHGGPQPTDTQVAELMSFGVVECERFYPAFQHVIWAGRSAEEALAAAIIDPVGEA